MPRNECILHLDSKICCKVMSKANRPKVYIIYLQSREDLAHND